MMRVVLPEDLPMRGRSQMERMPPQSGRPDSSFGHGAAHPRGVDDARVDEVLGASEQSRKLHEIC
eukprot:15429995-Heterocapsa_arctica.AAC.1